MKKQISNLPIYLLVLLAICISCKKATPPAVITSEITGIDGTSALSGGTITSEGSGTVLTRGVCWSTKTDPTTADSKTSDGSGAGSFISAVTGLNPATIYYVRAYATNEAGIGYGMTMSLTTLGGVPAAITYPASVISANDATLYGVVNANYAPATVIFEYGTSAGYGNTVTYNNNPVSGNANTNVSVDISGLLPATTYHYRIKTVNSLGTIYGDDMQFTTFGQIPTAIATSPFSFSDFDVSLTGIVNPNYLSTVVTFEYGSTTDYGNTITSVQSPLTGNSNTEVNATVSGLTIGNIYHFRIKAENSLGTTFTEDISFTPLHVVADIDGNTYQIIEIGTQTWMKENLKVTRYNDGSQIPEVTDYSSWSILTEPGYCYYDNYVPNMKIYGAMYNWYAVNTGKLCPDGWHVPSDVEWTTITDYLGGVSSAGARLKESGTFHWHFPNADATNESNFTALPAGYRSWSDGAYFSTGDNGSWWSSTDNNGSAAWSRAITLYGTTDVRVISNDYRYAISVRCMKN